MRRCPTGYEPLQSVTRHIRSGRNFPDGVLTGIQPVLKLVQQFLEVDLPVQMALKVVGGAIEQRGPPVSG